MSKANQVQKKTAQKTSTPAGINDEFSVMVVEFKKERNKLVAVSHDRMESILSTELSEGASIHVYDNKVKEDKGQNR